MKLRLAAAGIASAMFLVVPECLAQCDLESALAGDHIHVGDDPVSIESADLDADGVSDLVVSLVSDAGVLILKGMPDGTFAELGSLQVTGSMIEARVADFDSDGIDDVAAVTYLPDGPPYSLVHVWLGSGDGTFELPILTEFEGFGAEISIGRFNHDKAPDLLLTGAFQAASTVLLGQGDGTFIEGMNFDSGYGPKTASVVDLNGDGLDDVIEMWTDYRSNPIGSFIDIHHASADASFELAASFQFSSPQHWFHPFDVENDDDLDLIVTELSEDGMKVIRQGPAGTYVLSNPIDVPHQFTSVGVGDVNGDGLDDLVGSDFSAGGRLIVLLAEEDSDPVPAFEILGIAGASDIALRDIDSDGALDVLAVDRSAPIVARFLGHGDGTFQDDSWMPIPSESSSAIRVELNHDGFEDLAVLNPVDNTVDLLESQGDGTFEPTTQHPVGDDPVDQAWGDFNGDGHADLVVANGVDRSLTFLLGDGAGGFGRPISRDLVLDPRGVATTDLNGDGLSDVVWIEGWVNNLRVGLSNGDGSFSEGEIHFTGSQPEQVRLGDVNNDGHDDVVVADGWDDVFYTFLGNGDGTLSEPLTTATTIVKDFHFGYFNDDPYLDVVHTAFFSDLRIMFGLGDGRFGDSHLIDGDAVSWDQYSVDDVTGDGHDDIIASEIGVTHVLEFERSGTVVRTRSFAHQGHSPFAVFLMNADDDGVPDLVSLHRGSDCLSVVLNSCPPTCVADLDASGQTDVDDLLQLLGAWGTCRACPEDLNGDGAVNVVDLLAMLALWGPCP